MSVDSFTIKSQHNTFKLQVEKRTECEKVMQDENVHMFIVEINPYPFFYFLF